MRNILRTIVLVAAVMALATGAYADEPVKGEKAENCTTTCKTVCDAKDEACCCKAICAQHGKDAKASKDSACKTAESCKIAECVGDHAKCAAAKDCKPACGKEVCAKLAACRAAAAESSCDPKCIKTCGKDI